MKVEIVTPEILLYKGEASALTVPGANGAFQMLENHAAILSVLTAGEIKLLGDNIQFSENAAKHFAQGEKKGEYLLTIKGGTLEFNNNKATVLVD